ncbi:MAG: polysaccharide deacetylase family protein [Thiohalocapsa sp.]
MTAYTEASATTPATAAALVSIHDLMPSTMPAVRRTLRLLADARTAPVTLLVVPGHDWSGEQIRELKALQRDGHPLAGHGWLHRVERFGGLYHRLHGLTLSRRVAEHLALDDDGIVALINRCHAWFRDNGLDAPTLYVPPAWALGNVPLARLAADCPFSQYETLTGVIDAASGSLRRIPMLGYEADHALRIPVIRLWNAINRRSARAKGLLRIGIHPLDPELRLRRDLIADLERYRTTRDYSSLLVRP